MVGKTNDELLNSLKKYIGKEIRFAFNYDGKRNDVTGILNYCNSYNDIIVIHVENNKNSAGYPLHIIDETFGITSKNKVIYAPLLERSLGKEVEILYHNNERIMKKEIGALKYIDEDMIKLEDLKGESTKLIPFNNHNVRIEMIRDKEGNLLYKNLDAHFISDPDKDGKLLLF